MPCDTAALRALCVRGLMPCDTAALRALCVCGVMPCDAAALRALCVRVSCHVINQSCVSVVLQYKLLSG